MSQTDLIVSNGSGAAVRADINSQLQALGTLMSGTSGPSTTYAYMLWADTTNGFLKQRNAANTAWITLWTLSDPSATTSSEGIVELATTAETLTGTDTARALTAGGFAGSKSLATHGYMSLPGGLTLEWGQVAFSGTATSAVSFSASFSSIYSVVVGAIDPNASTDNAYAASITTSGFTAGRSSATGSGTVGWLAIGKV